MLRAFVRTHVAQRPPRGSVMIHLRQRHVAPRALDVADITRVLASPAVDVATYSVGQGLMYFVFFYSFFNWWYYREMRERWDEEDDEDDDMEY